MGFLGIGLLAGGLSVLGVFALVLAASACVSVFRNRALAGGTKAMWVALIVCFPLVGPVVYFGVRSDW